MPQSRAARGLGSRFRNEAPRLVISAGAATQPVTTRPHIPVLLGQEGIHGEKGKPGRVGLPCPHGLPRGQSVLLLDGRRAEEEGQRLHAHDEVTRAWPGRQWRPLSVPGAGFLEEPTSALRPEGDGQVDGSPRGRE